MGEQTAISWTDHTFNTWWGCERVSPGCQHCYAETFAKRTGHDVWGKGGDRRRFGDKHWAEPLKWDRQAEVEGRRHRVFCASMADVFEDRDDLDADRARLWELIEATPYLDWQLLTKRPQNVLEMVPLLWLGNVVMPGPVVHTGGWPANVWIGTTVEDQQRAEERIPELLKIPAAVRFLSCEPLLGKVTLGQWCASYPEALVWASDEWRPQYPERSGPPIHWVICGGESGPGHRPLELAHARTLLLNCQVFGIPFFFKQIGGQHPTSGGDLLDGVQYKAFPR